MRSSTGSSDRILRVRNPLQVPRESINSSAGRNLSCAPRNKRNTTKKSCGAKNKKRPGGAGAPVLPLLIPACAGISCGGGNSKGHLLPDTHKSKEQKFTQRAERNAPRSYPP